MVCDYICDVALDDAGADSNFTRGDARAALASYQEHGAIRFSETREQAKGRLIGDWSNDDTRNRRRAAHPRAHEGSATTERGPAPTARTRTDWRVIATTASHIIIL